MNSTEMTRALIAERRKRNPATTRPTSASTESLADYIARVAPQHTPIPWHLQQLIALLERAIMSRVFALVSMPPRHAKTTTIRRALSWAIAKYPDRLNGLAMHGETSARHQSRQVRKMARAEGVTLAPDAQNTSLWLTPEEGGLYAAGVLGQWTGKGIGGLLVCDDLIKGRESAESQTLRDRVWEALTDDIMTRSEPPCGSIVVVETRWHDDDPPGRILEQMGHDGFPEFEVINLPALRDPRTNKPSDADSAIALWPERFPVDDLRTRRAVLGAYGWASLFQGQPRPRGGRVFQRDDPPRFEERLPDHARAVVLSVDAAGTENTRSDWTVMGALEFEGSGPKMVCNVLDVERYQLEPSDIAPLLLAFQKKHADGSAFRIEATRDGKAIAKALRKLEQDLTIIEVVPIGDKYIRAQPVAAAWNQGRVRVPKHAPWVDEFLREIRKFTGSGKGKDDQVDMLSQGWNEAVNGGVTYGVSTVGESRDPIARDAGDDRPVSWGAAHRGGSRWGSRSGW